MTFSNIANEMRGNFEIHYCPIAGAQFHIADKNTWTFSNPLIQFKGTIVEEQKLKPKCQYQFTFGIVTPQSSTLLLAPLRILQDLGKIDMQPVLFPMFEMHQGIKERIRYPLELQFVPYELITIEDLKDIPLIGLRVLD